MAKAKTRTTSIKALKPTPKAAKKAAAKYGKKPQSIKKAAAKKSIVSSKTQFNSSVLTHKVVEGKYKSWKGEVLETKEGLITLRLWINGTGRESSRRRPLDVSFLSSVVAEINHIDILGLVQDDGDAEDKALLKYESGTWICGSCKAINKNDGSNCNALVDGIVCGKVRHLPIGSQNIGWGDCFKNVNFHSNGWKCSTCSVPNKADANVCISCESMKA